MIINYLTGSENIFEYSCFSKSFPVVAFKTWRQIENKISWRIYEKLLNLLNPKSDIYVIKKNVLKELFDHAFCFFIYIYDFLTTLIIKVSFLSFSMTSLDRV